MQPSHIPNQKYPYQRNIKIFTTIGFFLYLFAQNSPWSYQNVDTSNYCHSKIEASGLSITSFCFIGPQASHTILENNQDPWISIRQLLYILYIRVKSPKRVREQNFLFHSFCALWTLQIWIINNTTSSSGHPKWLVICHYKLLVHLPFYDLNNFISLVREQIQLSWGFSSFQSRGLQVYFIIIIINVTYYVII